MAEVQISYKGSAIAQMNASGTKTLLTEGKYLEDDVTVEYTRPSAPSGTKNISITQNGTTTEDVTAYASAQITANVPNTYAAGDEGKVVSSGALVSQTSRSIDTNGTYDTTTNNEVVVNVSGSGYSADDIALRTPISGNIVLKSTTTQIKDYAFRNTEITSITGAGVTSIGANALQYTKLTSFSLPNLTTVSGNSSFANITTLGQAFLPSLTSMGNITYLFSSCTALSVCDLGSVTAVRNYTFSGCSSLRALILRKTDAVTTVHAANANVLGGIFNNPTASTIYVPRALISTYQTATNWSTLYSNGVTFAAIEGSIYE